MQKLLKLTLDLFEIKKEVPEAQYFDHLHVYLKKEKYFLKQCRTKVA